MPFKRKSPRTYVSKSRPSGGWKRTRNLAFLLLLPVPALLAFYPRYLVLYIILFLSSVLLLGLFVGRKQSQFSCITCGLCCSLTVKPTEKDIKKIEETGRKREDFIDKGHLRKVQGFCSFLKKDGEKFVCSIYDYRPEVCRKWPFQSRVVKWKWFFLCPSLRSIIRPSKNTK